MKRKKVIVLIASALAAVCIIGATLAYFTSTDSVSNPFSTGGIDENYKNGIDVVENYPNLKDPKDIVPGTNLTKEVQVRNTSSYDQFIKVHFVVKFPDGNNVDESGNQVYKDNIDLYDTTGKKVNVSAKDFLDNYLTLNLADIVDPEDTAGDDAIAGILEKDTTTGEALISSSYTSGKWIKDNNDTNPNSCNYYYLGKVSSLKFTNKILDSVQLNLTPPAGSNIDGNSLQKIKYSLDVVADGIQAENNAFTQGWSDISNPDIVSALTKLGDKDAANLDGVLDPDVKAFENITDAD